MSPRVTIPTSQTFTQLDPLASEIEDLYVKYKVIIMVVNEIVIVDSL